MKGVLVVRPDWQTDVACKWGAEHLRIKTLRRASKDFVTTDLYADDARLTKITDNLPIHKFASMLGHGDAKTYTAQDKYPILKYKNDETEVLCKDLGETAINFLSCSVGQKLVPWLCESGLRAAAGYEDLYVFVIDKGHFPNDFAEPFFYSHCTFDYSILQGKSVEEAYQDSQAEYERQIEVANQYIKRHLISDWEAQNRYGDVNFEPLYVEEPPPEPEPPEPEPEPEPPTEKYVIFDGKRTSSWLYWLLSGNITLEGKLKEKKE